MDPKISKSKQIIQSFNSEAKQFYQFHGVQMIGSKFPIELVETLHNKLKKQVYDGGEYLEIIDTEQNFEVKAKHLLSCQKHVFLIDHALTFRYPQLRNVLKKNPKIIPRLNLMLKYHQKRKPVPKQQEQKDYLQLEFQNLGLTEITLLELPFNILTLSLINNNLTNAEQIMKKLQYLNLKALWLNNNPVAQNTQLSQFITKKTKIQLYNSCFTPNCTQWGLKFVQNNDIKYASTTLNQKIFVLNLDNRNIYNVPVTILSKFPNLRSLSLRGHTISSQDDREYIYQILKVLPRLRILLVDQEIERQLIGCKVCVNKHDSKMQPVEAGEAQLELIMHNLPKIAGCYRLANTVQLDQSSCWYVNDELGSMLGHSDSPTAKIAPFLYAPNNAMDQHVQAFSVLWILKDVKEGEAVTIDYLHSYTEEKQRSYRLAIWNQLPQQPLQSTLQKYNAHMHSLVISSLSAILDFYQKNSILQVQAANSFYLKPLPQKFTVVTDYSYIKKYLTHPSFQIVEQKADILWLSGAMDEEEWKELRGKHYLNQFPYEGCLVMKDNLANTVQSVFGDTSFLMRTYNLQRELDVFIADFENRVASGMDNLWILKPPNMARSMDMLITDNLSLIIKVMETGPKIVQKYISNPVLREGRKIDLRYVLLVRSIQPLVLFLYKHFWVRSANNVYTTDRRYLAAYQTQFTVMNYGAVSDFKQIAHQKFEQQFQKDYAPVKWREIHEKIKKMLRNVFIAAATKHPQMHDSNSRTLYGIDVMIDAETLQPKLLEITFSPDCKRACEYYPSFYNDVFETLFLNGNPQSMERII